MRISPLHLLICYLLGFSVAQIASSIDAWALERAACSHVTQCSKEEDAESCLIRLSEQDTDLGRLSNGMLKAKCRIDNFLFVRGQTHPRAFIAICHNLGVELPATLEQSEQRADALANDKKTALKSFQADTNIVINNTLKIIDALGCTRYVVPEEGLSLPNLPRIFRTTCMCDVLNTNWLQTKMVFNLIVWQTTPEDWKP